MEKDTHTGITRLIWICTIICTFEVFVFTCWLVCWFVRRITQNLLNRFPQNWRMSVWPGIDPFKFWSGSCQRDGSWNLFSLSLTLQTAFFLIWMWIRLDYIYSITRFVDHQKLSQLLLCYFLLSNSINPSFHMWGYFALLCFESFIFNQTKWDTSRCHPRFWKKIDVSLFFWNFHRPNDLSINWGHE